MTQQRCACSGTYLYFFIHRPTVHNAPALAGLLGVTEVTSRRQHVRWRRITGRMQRGAGKCRWLFHTRVWACGVCVCYFCDESSVQIVDCGCDGCFKRGCVCLCGAEGGGGQAVSLNLVCCLSDCSFGAFWVRCLGMLHTESVWTAYCSPW